MKGCNGVIVVACICMIVVELLLQFYSNGDIQIQISLLQNPALESEFKIALAGGDAAASDDRSNNVRFHRRTTYRNLTSLINEGVGGTSSKKSYSTNDKDSNDDDDTQLMLNHERSYIDYNKSSDSVDATVSAAVTSKLESTKRAVTSNRDGKWLEDILDWPLVPIHTVLLKTGKVLTYGTDTKGRNGRGFYYDIWDPKRASHHTTLPTTTNTNIFCAGQVHVPNTDTILLVGGSQVMNGKRNYGTTATQLLNVYNYTLQHTTATINGSRNAGMQYPRWYPSVTTLPNGNILVQGGWDDKRHPVLTPEMYNPTTKKWRTLIGATSEQLYSFGWWYPKVYATNNNQVIVIPRTRFNRKIGKRMEENLIWKLDTRGSGRVEIVGDVDTLDAPDNTNESAMNLPMSRAAPSVMYDAHKILVIQGYDSGKLINIKNPNKPRTSKTGNFARLRAWCNLVALPTGEVAAIGGSSTLQSLDDAVLDVEIWNPNTGIWYKTKSLAQKARLYHSTALLLPDGTIFVGGGGPPGPVVNQNVEIYEPPYLFDGNGQRALRPHIVSIDGHHISVAESRSFSLNDTAAAAEPIVQLRRGDVIPIEYNASSTRIRRVSLIRLGSVTHSFNMDERMVSLKFQHGDLSKPVAAASTAFTTRNLSKVEADKYDDDFLTSPHATAFTRDNTTTAAAAPMSDEIIQNVVAKIPSNRAIIIPGYYMLFVINMDNTPSIGQIVSIQ